ncbi:P-loop NTPase fold protein [Vibrio sp. NH-UV-68]|uniref:KAP family P-loop NTPase fold protein n=1 Tax=unclassified Vibrio TaxID=2614977 RepID=UPI0036F3404D
MDKTLKIEWKEDVTVLGEQCPADKLDRAKYAQFLTNFLADQGFDATKEKDEQKQNYVLNLNSEWGSGKTYFLKRWYENLKPYYPVVYVDAWKQDYSDDPLMTVISSMTKQLREQAGKAEDDLLFKAPRKALGLLKAALPSAAGVLAKRYMGIDPVAIMEAADEGVVGETIKDADGNDIDMGAAASKLVQYLLDEHDAKSDAIASLKKSVGQWIEAAQSKKMIGYPAFIFIDELDRCRPSYAVEMLETIKHIFDIPGVVFVVGTDTEQLQHAVKAIYGEGFDARTYLGRFFNSRCTLQEPSFANLLETHCDVLKLQSEHFNALNLTVYPISIRRKEENANFQIVTAVFEAMSLSPRQSIQITNRLIAIIDNLSANVVVDIIYLTFLLSLKEKHTHLYKEMCSTPHHLPTGRTEINDFIGKRKFNEKLITLYFQPSVLHQYFSFSPMTTTSNRWKDGRYTCSLKSYLIEINSFLTSSNDSHSDQKIQAAANQQRQNNMSLTSGHLWVSIEYMALHNEGGQSFDFYKDLVDLSSALDSIELAEDD